MQIYLRPISGRIITITINKDDMIERIKEKIKEKEGIPIEEILIYKNGSILLDHKLLSDYGIESYDTLKYLKRKLILIHVIFFFFSYFFYFF